MSTGDSEPMPVSSALLCLLLLLFPIGPMVLLLLILAERLGGPDVLGLRKSDSLERQAEYEMARQERWDRTTEENG